MVITCLNRKPSMALTKSTKDVSIHSRALCTVTEVWNAGVS